MTDEREFNNESDFSNDFIDCDAVDQEEDGKLGLEAEGKVEAGELEVDGNGDRQEISESENDPVESTGGMTAESVVESVLFASDEPLSAIRLGDLVETSVKQVKKHVRSLNEKYEENNNAFRIEEIAGGYQMMTLSRYNNWLKKLVRVRDDSKLTPAALECLAIIAYKQPVIRADIEAVRGVASGEIIRNLMFKGMVKIVGRAEVLGRPMLYGTTKKFLVTFGLKSLKDLPKIEELKKPAE